MTEDTTEVKQTKFNPELRKRYIPIRPRVQKILKEMPHAVSSDIKTRKAIRNTTAENLMELSEEGRTDPLTDLRNERGFKESLRVEVERAIRNGQVLGLIAIDLDNFKMVNDRYGHAKGDEVLKTIASIINEHLPGKESITRTIDIAARPGGDELFIICPDIKGGLELAAERVRIALENLRKNVPGIEDVPISASVGASSFTPQIQQAGPHYEEVERVMEQLKKEADTALYVSKHGGKNRLTIFQPGMIMPQGPQT